MSMGRRSIKNNWWENDLVTDWRYDVCYMQNHSGAAKVKRSFRRRERRVASHEVRSTLPFYAYDPTCDDDRETEEGIFSIWHEHMIVNGRDVWSICWRLTPWGYDDDWNNGTELPYTTETGQQ